PLPNRAPPALSTAVDTVRGLSIVEATSLVANLPRRFVVRVTEANSCDRSFPARIAWHEISRFLFWAGISCLTRADAVPTPCTEKEPAPMPPEAKSPQLHFDAASRAAVVRLAEEELREANVGLTGKRLFQLAEVVGPRGLELDLAAVQ